MLSKILSMAGCPSMIIHSDEPLLRIRTLSVDEVRRSGLSDIEVPDLNYLGELHLKGSIPLYVAVLHRDSVMAFSRLNGYDALIVGTPVTLDASNKHDQTPLWQRSGGGVGSQPPDRLLPRVPIQDRRA